MAKDDIELAPGIRIICADCKEVLPDIGLVDAVVTDPPYGLSFMGKKWDYDIPSVEIWQAILECLKPGGHLLAFAGTRTQHRMACAIEDAGFDIRDCLMWHYSQGFPKSLDISKAIDRMAGAEREIIGRWKPTGTARPQKGGSHSCAKTTSDCGYDPDTEAMIAITAPATESAKQWAGWGTALKPATEIITMARKPLDNCTIAENVLRHGTGGINVDGCRIGTVEDTTTRHNSSSSYMTGRIGEKQPIQPQYITGSTQGRWPANLIHDGSEDVLRLFPVTKSQATLQANDRYKNMQYAGSGYYGTRGPDNSYSDIGSAARFFYTAKASKSDRDEGDVRNIHSTVKPTTLMRYLCRLITPPKGIVLDPFMGSGSTGKAAIREGFRFIGIERDREYFEIARKRIEAELKQGRFDF